MYGRTELINKIRGQLNKYGDETLGAVHVAHRYVSPPYKGMTRYLDKFLRRNEKIYPPQLMGVSSKTDKQKIRIEGAANQTQGFGGPVGAYGSPTGGSYYT